MVRKIRNRKRALNETAFLGSVIVALLNISLVFIIKL